eukprot:1253727-Amphidinium_carterae.1
MGVLCAQAASLKDAQRALELLARQGQIGTCHTCRCQVVDCHSHYCMLWTVVAFFYPQRPFQVVA